jgi:hypothetical protein
MQTSQETDSGLKKEIQHEGEYDRKDDRACHVERRQGTQPEQTTEEERPRIGRQRHLCLASITAAGGFGKSSSGSDGKEGRCSGGAAAAMLYLPENVIIPVDLRQRMKHGTLSD